MPKIEELARSALEQNALELRALVLVFIEEHPMISDIQRPDSTDERILAAAASLIELLAIRANQIPPEWTAGIPPMKTPMYLLKAAERMKHLRDLCRSQSPEPLKKRGFYAPPDFLVFV